MWYIIIIIQFILMCLLILYESFDSIVLNLLRWQLAQDSIYWGILSLKKTCVTASLLFCNNLLIVFIVRVMIQLASNKGEIE